MFGLTKKRRYKEFLRRAVKAVMQGGYLPPSDVQRLGLNEQAKTELASRADAIHLYLLNAIFVSLVGQQYKWATSQFVLEAIADVCAEYDRAFRRSPGRTAGHLVLYIQRISEMSADEREAGKQFSDAIDEVGRLDPSVDSSELYQMLRGSAEQFYADVERKLREALA